MSDQVREAFELWYVGHTFDKTPPEIERDAKGYYRLMQTRSSWDAYHAGWLDRIATPPNGVIGGTSTPPSEVPHD